MLRRRPPTVICRWRPAISGWTACPLHHIGRLAILWRCARAGAGVLLHDGFNAEAVAADLARQPVTHLSLVPQAEMLARLLETGATPPPSLRHVMIGGTALAEPCMTGRTPPLATKPELTAWRRRPIAAWMAGRRPWHEGLVGRPLGRQTDAPRSPPTAASTSTARSSWLAT